MKIMKLIRNKHRGKEGFSRRDTETIQFIKDFHKQYQSLYELYDNLRGEVREKIVAKDEMELSPPSSSSSSDSESYYSPAETASKSSESGNESKKGKQRLKKKLENYNLELAELRNKLSAMNEEKEVLNLEYAASLSKIQESEKIIEQLKTEVEKAETTKRELKDEFKEVDLPEESAQVKELESELTSLKLELGKLYENKREVEEITERKENESKELGEENIGLKSRISELEMGSKEKETEVSNLRKKLADKESKFKSKIKELTEKTIVMKTELDYLRAQKGELEETLLSKSNEALKSQTDGRNEPEPPSEKQTYEISDFLAHIENLEEKLGNKNLDEHRILQEKDSLEMKVKDLELELDSLRTEKIDLEDKIRGKNQESDKLSVKHSGLNVRILELEKLVMERDNEFSALQSNLDATEKDASIQIKALRSQVEHLKKELNSLQKDKNKLERERKDCLESAVSEMEKNNIESSKNVSDLQKTVKEKDGIIKKLNEAIKQEKGRSLDSKLSLQIAEKKSEEMAEEFRKKLEDSLRILSRRIRVAEQLHVENKEIYRKTKEKYEKEHVELKGRFLNNEAALKKVKDISLTANDLLAGLDSVALKFEECSGNFLNRISKVSCELKFAKDWVRRKNNAIKHVKEDVDCILAQLDGKEAEILGYREKVWKLENKAREMEKIVKEREEGMLGMGEEKREAIRQLCVWIDYHRSRCDYLKKILSEMSVRCQKTS